MITVSLSWEEGEREGRKREEEEGGGGRRKKEEEGGEDRHMNKTYVLEVCIRSVTVPAQTF